jgi:hypothetical protein
MVGPMDHLYGAQGVAPEPATVVFKDSCWGGEIVRHTPGTIELNCPGPIKIVLFSLVSMLNGPCLENGSGPCRATDPNFRPIPWNASCPSSFLTAADRDLNPFAMKN